MNTQIQTQLKVQSTSAPTFASVRTNLLQKKVIGKDKPTKVPPIVHEVLRSPGQPLDTATHAFIEPHFGHDFSRMRVHTDARAVESARAVNPRLNRSALPYMADRSSDEEESIEAPPLEIPSAEGIVAEGTTETELHAPTGGKTAPACPTSIQLESLTDLTPQGLRAGYLTGYGAIAKMKVLPDSTTFDGVHIDESLTGGSGSCPTGLMPRPCAAGIGFTIGVASGRSSILPQQPAQRNRFYDFHTTKWRSASLLHDATRNPKRMNSCTIICKQSYSCGGAVIGRFTITRTLSKSIFNRNDVTRVSVTKT